MKPRHRTTAQLSAALVLGLAAIGANALELRGFRGVTWGEGANALGTAVATQSDGDVTCYRRETENLLFGDSALNGVRYCFHQDRLFMVALDAAVDAKALSAEFQRAYGRPDARQGLAASWGNKTSGTHAELVANGKTTARLTIYSNKIEPALAKRMQLGPVETTSRTASSNVTSAL